MARGEVYPPLKQARKSTGSAAPLVPMSFPAGPSGEQATALSDAPGSAKKKRGRPSTAGKDETVANIVSFFLLPNYQIRCLYQE